MTSNPSWRILVVEPNPMARESIRAQLKEHELIFFDKHDKAHKRISSPEKRIDLVITHLGSPSRQRRPGIDTISIASEHGIPSLALTAPGAEDPEAIQLGAYAVLPKRPGNPNLKQTVERAIVSKVPHVVHYNQDESYQALVKNALMDRRVLSFSDPIETRQHLNRFKDKIEALITDFDPTTFAATDAARQFGLMNLAFAKEHDIPVVVFTGRANLKENALKSGADAVIIKSAPGINNQLNQVIKLHARRIE